MTQQKWLLSLFGDRPGYFVEAGAHDGIGDSQTKWLEDRGWTGICVEPSSAFGLLARSRRCRVDSRCLWSADGQAVRFWEVAGNGIELSGVAGCFADAWDRSKGRSVQKLTVTLKTLLAEHNAPPVFEYLCLDTEGSELEILGAHDFTSYRFLAASIEHNGVEPKRTLTRRLLADLGYALEARNPYPIEDWFVDLSLVSEPGHGV